MQPMTGKLKIIACNSNLELAGQIASMVGVPLVDAFIKAFPDGETAVEIKENIRGTDVFIVQSTSHPANHNIMELLITMDAVRRASAGRITAVMPFYGYARQDRKEKPRVPITSKLVANLLVAAGADRILTMDLHSPQITGFFDIPVDHLFSGPVFYDYLTKYTNLDLTVVSPDVGGLKLASVYAEKLNCPLGIVAKRRMDAENVKTISIIGEVEGRNILMVDDMAESGGTLTSAAKTLKEAGAKRVIAAVSHGVLNQKGYQRLEEGFVDEFVTTNSTVVKTENPIIRVLSVAGLFADAISRIHNNESVTNLFRAPNY